MRALKVGRFLILLGAFGIAVNASLYLVTDPDAFSFVEQRLVYADIQPVLMVHIAGGIVALVVGPLEFFPLAWRLGLH